MTTATSRTAAPRPTRTGFVVWVAVVTFGTAGGTVLAHLETHAGDQQTVAHGLPVVSSDIVARLRHQRLLVAAFRPDGPSWVRQSRSVRIDTSAEHDGPLSKAAAVTSAADDVGLSRKNAVAASLVSLTTPDTGIELQHDSTLPSHILPDYVHAATWVVVFRSVRFPVGAAVGAGAHAVGGGMSPPGGFVVFVDGYDGTLIVGTNVGPSAPSGGRASGVMSPSQNRGPPARDARR